MERDDAKALGRGARIERGVEYSTKDMRTREAAEASAEAATASDSKDAWMTQMQPTPSEIAKRQ